MNTYIVDTKTDSIEFDSREKAIEYLKGINYTCKMTKYDSNDDFVCFWMMYKANVVK